jgi:hypothetical protein
MDAIVFSEKMQVKIGVCMVAYNCYFKKFPQLGSTIVCAILPTPKIKFGMQIPLI